MLEHGALNSMMSGSGPTVFGLFEDEKTAVMYEPCDVTDLADKMKKLELIELHKNQ